MKYKKKINGYQNYLLYKKTLERLGQSDCGRREIAEYAGIHINSTMYMIRTLQKENVIKMKSFEINLDGAKRMIYTLVQDVK